VPFVCLNLIAAGLPTVGRSACTYTAATSSQNKQTIAPALVNLPSDHRAGGDGARAERDDVPPSLPFEAAQTISIVAVADEVPRRFVALTSSE
jgi:hypothetical protein